MVEVEEIENGLLTLEVGRHMSLIKFIKWLNNSFEKKSKKDFTAQDAYGYIKRGNLPYHFGVYKLIGTSYPELGLKMVEVVDLNKSEE